MSDTQRVVQYGHTYLHRYTCTYTVTHPSEFGFKFVFGIETPIHFLCSDSDSYSDSDFEFERPTLMKPDRTNVQGFNSPRPQEKV